MNINYTPQAKSDLIVIRDYVAEDSPVVADQVIMRILQSMSVLENFPLIGRPGRVADTREWSISGLPYIGVYTIASETEIDVIAILHTSRQWP